MSIMDQENRVVVLIDMDCFYCQVEEKLDPALKGKPIAVVQYNPWKGGGIIAVNYVARAMGVTRHMRGDEAKEKCPEIVLPSVPCQRGKADISKYRDAGKEVAMVLQKFTSLLERASIDEAYLDITAPVEERLRTLNIHTVDTSLVPHTFALGYESLDNFICDVHSYRSDSMDFDYEHAKRLLVGAVIVSEIRAAVAEETGYTCSAGIAHNKILAKLVCGMNKPNKQTVLPKHSVNILYKTLSVKKVKHLGGKFGDTVCDVLKICKMGELQRFSEKELQARFDEKNGTWLYNIARGIDLEPVQARFNPKSIGCCKQLRGKSALHDLESLRKWLKDLGDEIEDRLEKDALENNRTPKQMVVSFTMQLANGKDTSSSRSYNFVADDELCGDFFASKALELVMDTTEGAKVKDGEANRKLKAIIKFLGISVGKFEDHSESKKTRKIVDFFTAGSANVTDKKPKDNAKQIEPKDISDKKHECKDNIMQKFLQDGAKTEKTQETAKDETLPQVNETNDKKNDGNDYIMQKFLQSSTKVNNTQVKEETVTKELKENRKSFTPSPILESGLDKQESFFAKFLNEGTNKNTTKSVETSPQNTTIVSNDNIRPTTPICKITNCGDDSNDSEYSNATIEMEINKSIALFEDEPIDTSQVDNIRGLLKSTVKHHENEDIQSEATVAGSKNPSPQEPDTFECFECNKIIAVNMLETHSDYHLALKLREEERERVRQEVKVKRETKKKPVVKAEEKKRKTDETKAETASIANFLVKVDDSIPTEMCLECGKRIPVEKIAEHSDFHEAQKLSREINKKSPPSYFMGNSVKRKRKTVSPAKKNKLPCHSKSIDSFFR